MKTLALSLALLVSTALVANTAKAHTASGPADKVVLTAAKYLMKLYSKNTRNVKQVNVPELTGYSLTQVALINENQNQALLNAFDYVAVYQEKGSTNMKVVLYNEQNKEQLTLDSIRSVTFGSENDNTRIVLHRADSNNQLSTEILLVPGKVQVAQKG